MFGYIGKHWRGEFSLPQSYWVNGVLALLPFNLYLRIVGEIFTADPPGSPAVYVFAYLLPFLAFLPFAVWSGVGIWRSAGHRIAEGRSGWSWVARIVVLFNALFLSLSIAGSARINYAIVWAYFDERAATFSVEGHGDYAVFHGVITDAAANQLAPLLNDPKMRRLVINGSNGGFVTPALRLAKIIHARQLDVVALAQCDSSCTALLAAGGMRAVDPKTLVGFHLGTLAGLDDAAKGWDEVDRYYADAGMSKALIAKIRTHHGPNDLYTPPLRELIDDGFLTDIYVEDVKAYIPAPRWCEENPKPCSAKQ